MVINFRVAGLANQAGAVSWAGNTVGYGDGGSASLLISTEGEIGIADGTGGGSGADSAISDVADQITSIVGEVITYCAGLTGAGINAQDTIGDSEGTSWETGEVVSAEGEVDLALQTLLQIEADLTILHWTDILNADSKLVQEIPSVTVNTVLRGRAIFTIHIEAVRNT